MVYLLDTSALLAHHRKEAGWARVQAIFEDSDSDVIAASVSLTEMARRLKALGASDAEACRSVSLYEQVVDGVVPIDRDVAMAAFKIGSATRGRLPLADSLIAAAAAQNSACLVHRDAHMTLIPSSILQQLQLSDAT